MNKKKINIIILFIALTLVLYFTLKEDLNGILYELSKINTFIFAICILVFILSMVFKSLSLHAFLKDCNKNYLWKNSFSMVLISQFLNGITPFQSGGQPFEVYLLKKQGIRISESTSALIKDFISFQIALILMGVFAIIINNYFCIIPENFSLNLFILIGFIINLIVLVFLFIIISPKEFHKKLAKKLIDFLFKFKIVKKLKIDKENIEEGLERFCLSGRQLRKEKKKFLLAILFNFANLILLYIIPFILFMALDVNSVSVLKSIVITAFVMLIGNFIPIPGATGGIEYSFMQFFGVLSIKNQVLSSVMLLWRFVTYFLGMILGFICLVITKGGNKQ